MRQTCNFWVEIEHEPGNQNLEGGALDSQEIENSWFSLLLILQDLDVKEFRSGEGEMVSAPRMRPRSRQRCAIGIFSRDMPLSGLSSLLYLPVLRKSVLGCASLCEWDLWDNSCLGPCLCCNIKGATIPCAIKVVMAMVFSRKISKWRSAYSG